MGAGGRSRQAGRAQAPRLAGRSSAARSRSASGASGCAYAKATNLMGADAAAFVMSAGGVVAQTDEQARASTVDTDLPAPPPRSRDNERPHRHPAAHRPAHATEARGQEEEGSRQAGRAGPGGGRQGRACERSAMRAIRQRQQDPQAAAAWLMVDHGWTSGRAQ
jgi:hypothetical protein